MKCALGRSGGMPSELFADCLRFTLVLIRELPAVHDSQFSCCLILTEDVSLMLPC